MRVLVVPRGFTYGRSYAPEEVRSVEHFPHGSAYLREPHWHVRYDGGFRTNVPEALYHVMTDAR